MQWFEEKPIAHRGWHWIEGVDENSWESFEEGIAKGYPIEFDVHCSSDGVSFIHHDHSLKRMTDIDVLGTDLTAEELKGIRTHHSSKGIPLLKDVLDFVDGRVPLVIEIKRTESGNRLESSVLDCLKNYKGEYALQSFHPQTLIFLKENANSAPIGLLSGDLSDTKLSPFTRIMLKSLCLVPYIKPHYIGYQWDFTSDRAPQKMRKENGIPLLAWTVRDEIAKGFCNKWADNIIFENIID